MLYVYINPLGNALELACFYSVFVLPVQKREGGRTTLQRDGVT